MGIVAALGVASGAAAETTGITWSSTTLRHVAGAGLADADFDRHRIAAAWQEAGPATWVRTSTTSGLTFAARELVADDSRMAELDVCGDDLYVTYAKHLPTAEYPDRWLIDVAERGVGAVGFTDHAVSFGVENGRDPDVTCAGPGRLFVSWLQRTGDSWRVKLNHALRADGVFPAGAIDVGTGPVNRGEPVVAGVSDRAYVAWVAHDGIRFRRWGVGGAPGHAVTSLGGARLAAGSNQVVPVIAARDDKVVVAWTDCGSIRARVSNDRGATWGPQRTIFQGACGSEFGGLADSATIHAGRIVVAFSRFAESLADQRMSSTTNDFTTRSNSRIYDDNDGFVLGFATHPEGFELVAAVDTGSRIRYLRGPNA